MPLLVRRFVASACVLALGGALPSTVSSDTALVGWAAGPAVAAELNAEKTMMSVPSAANAMEIERHLSSVPHRAGSAADYATALYVRLRLANDGFTTHIQEYEVAFTGAGNGAKALARMMAAIKSATTALSSLAS